MPGRVNERGEGNSMKTGHGVPPPQAFIQLTAQLASGVILPELYRISFLDLSSALSLNESSGRMRRGPHALRVSSLDPGSVV